MSVMRRVRGLKILKAVSSPLRLQILDLLSDKGPLSYTELMASLKMNPSRDAGRFAYHLKSLLKADLIEAVVESRKYCITELGRLVLHVAERIEAKALKPKSMLVRTSRSALEEFDAHKIADSLIKEAKMPPELAQKVAKEAEKQLLRSKTKYLTAPLVREVVNVILIEKGLEEYRHKLTRLGVPVHDVTNLMESKGTPRHKSLSVSEAAGSAVFKEYTLLNVFPRDIADAHLSGSLHVNDLSSWILKPTEIMHDIRFFLHTGLNLENVSPLQPSYAPPKDFESALHLLFNVVLHSVNEVSAAQTLDYFNVFLAPFAKGMNSSKLKDLLHLFIENTSQYADASIGLELTLPDFIAEKQSPSHFGKLNGPYADFMDEIQLLASLLFEVLAEESARKPMFNPRFIVKMRPETFTDQKAKALLLKAHGLASERGTPYFAGLLHENQKHSIFSFSGCKLDEYLNRDWEIDTLRTGCLGIVTINMPRIVYESGRDKPRFFEILGERVEMATRALEIKYRAMKQFGKGLLPFIMQNGNGDQYFRLETCSRIINMAGLKEAAQAITGKDVVDEITLEFAAEIAQTVVTLARRMGRRRLRRLSPAVLPSSAASRRLAVSDIERFGVAKVKFSGTRDKPFYSILSRLTLHEREVPQESLRVESRLGGTRVGGGLAAVELGDVDYTPDELMAVTRQLLEVGNLEFFVYDRKLTYCLNCRRTWYGLLHKCPSCGAIGTLAFFDRFGGT